jgi:biotin carboxyl carrier protein
MGVSESPHGSSHRFLARIGDRDIALDLRPRADGDYDVVARDDDRRFQISGRGSLRSVATDGRSVEAAAWRSGAAAAEVAAGDAAGHDRGGEAAWDVVLGGRLRAVRIVNPLRSGQGRAGATKGAASEVRAVMPGRVVAVLVAAGEEVVAGQGLIVVEAMKMENEMTSPRAGKIAAVPARAGETVEAGTILVTLE